MNTIDKHIMYLFLGVNISREQKIHYQPWITSSLWKGEKPWTNTKFCGVFIFQPTVKLFIDGKFVESRSDKWIDIHNPVSKAALGFKLTRREFWECGGKLETRVFVMKYIVLPVWLAEERTRGKNDVLLFPIRLPMKSLVTFLWPLRLKWTQLLRPANVLFPPGQTLQY